MGAHRRSALAGGFHMAGIALNDKHSGLVAGTMENLSKKGDNSEMRNSCSIDLERQFSIQLQPTCRSSRGEGDGPSGRLGAHARWDLRRGCRRKAG